MIIGLTSDHYKKIPLHLILSALRWVGLEYSEVTCNVFKYPALALRAGRGMRLGLHLPTWGSVGHDFSHPSCKSENEQLLTHLSMYGRAFGFLYGVIHPPEGDEKEISVAYFFENIRRIKLPLVLENIPQWPLKQFIDFYVQATKELPHGRLHLCLDIPHAYLSDGEWLPFFKTYHHDIKLIHLSNCAQGEDWHYPFQVPGDLELFSVLEQLKQYKYKGMLNLELYPHEPSHIHGILDTYLQAREYIESGSFRRNNTRAALLAFAGSGLARIMRVVAWKRGVH